MFLANNAEKKERKKNKDVPSKKETINVYQKLRQAMQ